MFCLPFWYFPLIFSPFPFIPFHYFLYSPNEWDHIMFVLLRLTYFTQHNTFQFHPRWSKWWVSVISNDWVIFHCIYKPHLLYPFNFDGQRDSFHSLAIVDIPNINLRVQVSRRFIASESLRLIPNSAISGSLYRSIFISLWNLHRVFQSGCTSSHSHQQWFLYLGTPMLAA